MISILKHVTSDRRKHGSSETQTLLKVSTLGHVLHAFVNGVPEGKKQSSILHLDL